MEEKKETEFDKLNGLLDYYSHLTELQLFNLLGLKKAKLRREQSTEDKQSPEDRDRTEKHTIAIIRALNQKKPKK
ncbi:MAG: hypothetical protein II956_08325 [Bacteroidales bacterium]|nr:hypothetical protein [Bacteroidales bacterium]